MQAGCHCLLAVTGLAALAWGGCSGNGPPRTSQDFAQAVRDTYHDIDAEAFGAWDAADAGQRHLAVALRSLPPLEPLLRFDFWLETPQGAPEQYGRSTQFPGVNDAEVTLFTDVNQDGVPDLAAALVDSTGMSRPVLILGGRGEVGDVLAELLPEWRFAAGRATPPEPVGCAVRFWVLGPAPDSLPEGWRYLPIYRRRVGTPQPFEPACPAQLGFATCHRPAGEV